MGMDEPQAGPSPTVRWLVALVAILAVSCGLLILRPWDKDRPEQEPSGGQEARADCDAMIDPRIAEISALHEKAESLDASAGESDEKFAGFRHTVWLNYQKILPPAKERR